MGKCVYCRGDISDDRAVDVCDACGEGVWGKKMFQTIKDNMDDARGRGDLNQGLINIGNECQVKTNSIG